jgi:predicted transcriptional regulator
LLSSAWLKCSFGQHEPVNGTENVEEKLVCDVMRRGVITCRVDEPLVSVVRRLHECSIDAIFVLDESGGAIGVISHTDVARAYVQGDWKRLIAEDVMTSGVVTVIGDLILKAAIQIMLDKRLHHLLIVQGGLTPNRPVGVLSLNDVVAEMCASSA